MAAVVLSTLAMPTAWTTWTDIEALSNRKLREFILAAGLPVDGLVTKAELKVKTRDRARARSTGRTAGRRRSPSPSACMPS